MEIWYVGYPTHWTRFFYLDFQMEYNRGRHRVWVRANRGLSYMKIGPGSGSTFTARCGWASKGPSPSGLKIDGPPDADLQKTVVRTNKGRTNKGQITFFRKIYWGLIRDKYYICKKKFSTKQKIADFLFRPVFFWKKAQFTDRLKARSKPLKKYFFDIFMMWNKKNYQILRHRITLWGLFDRDFINSFTK